MAAPSRVSYRHFLYPTATRAVLLASQSMTPRHDYMAQIVQTDAPAPADVTFQDESTMYNGAGSVDLGDLVMALGNWLPYRYTATGQKWDFLWQDDAAPTTYSAPVTYNKMMMWSATQQCYEMEEPTLTRLQLDLRRRGESTMTTEWLAQDLQKITRPANPPTPNPVTKQKIVRNHQWQVEHSEDAFNFTQLEGVVRATFDVPSFREGVFTMSGTGASWDDIADGQVTPMVSVYMLVNSDWADNVFGRTNEQYLRITGSNDFTLLAHGKKSAQDPFTLDGNKMVVKADFTLVGTYAPGEPALFSSLVVATPTPTTTRFSVTPGGGALFAVGDTIDVDGDETVITTLVTDRITVSPALSSAPSTNNVVTRLPAWPQHRWASFEIANTPHTTLT